ncbi:MAG: guanylate kinase [Holosporaceae bacterium]|jgi:guanylate kinase|nr:guanylate kinase [Holosporaceae bacterium]
MRYGYLFVISGPSAVGKTSIINEILKLDNSLKQVITCTTRPMRKTERQGIDYYFMSKKEFLTRERNGDFIEFSEVYGNYYGVMLSLIMDKVNNCENALLSVNWEGFAKVKKTIGQNVYGFFINPPSIQDLELRIRSRGTDSREIINHRLSMAMEDMSHSNIFDFCVENRDITTAANHILEQINIIKQTNEYH